MNRLVLTIAVVVIIVGVSGCSEVQGDDYGDAPESIQDGSLDYQDYKEAGCPYLDGSLDQQDMEKCNEWIQEQTENSTTTVAS